MFDKLSSRDLSKTFSRTFLDLLIKGVDFSPLTNLISCINSLPNISINSTHPLFEFNFKTKQESLPPEIHIPPLDIGFLYGGQPLAKLIDKDILTR
jgi:hypothetical protein